MQQHDDDQQQQTPVHASKSHRSHKGGGGGAGGGGGGGATGGSGGSGAGGGGGGGGGTGGGVDGGAGAGAAAGGGGGGTGAGGESGEHGTKRKAGIFSRELRLMMYGFGDDPDPLPETVELVEEIVVDYLTDIVHKAMDLSSKRGKLTVEDVLFLVRKDPRKFSRAKELLAMSEELKEARRNFAEQE